MSLSRARIHNYKSVWDSGWLEFDSSFSAIVGQNNVGKSAVLEALSFAYGNKPHRSMRTAPTRHTPVGGEGKVEFTMRITPDVMHDLMVAVQQRFYMWGSGASAKKDLAMISRVLRSTFHIDGTWTEGRMTEAAIRELPPILHTKTHTLALTASDDNAVVALDAETPVEMQSLGYHLPYLLANALRMRIYAFKAQRLNIGAAGVGADSTLSPDASNLAQVLNRLQSSNPALWDEYVRAVRTVLPQVKGITVPPTVNSQVEIFIWTVPPATRRDDLAMRLSESGTGIGQVLAILYVVLTSDLPRTLLIDEPQSFLHPGAVRKLIEICRAHPQHQYIITTHSAGTLVATRASTTHLLTASGNETTVTQLDATDTNHLRQFLGEVGVRLSDVFGADNILWVEGKTEEVCFPIIIASRGDLPVQATATLAVTNTGDFARKDAEKTFAIYERLSQGPRLMPPVVGFIFDREERTSKELADLRRRSQGKIRFTTRRMFENYLLNLRGLTALLSELSNHVEGNAPKIHLRAVGAWVRAHLWDDAFFSRPVSQSERTKLYWYTNIDGAAFLRALFAAHFDEKILYDKVEHGVMLTSWLTAHCPQAFDELVATIRELLNAASDATVA